MLLYLWLHSNLPYTSKMCKPLLTISNRREQKEINSVQKAGRPGIIISNDKLNNASPVVEMVYLTTKKKSNIPAHVEITSSGVHSIALCEQIVTVPVERLEKKCGQCSEAEMDEINKALCYSIQLPIRETIERMKREIEIMKAQLGILKELCIASIKD